MGIDPFNAARNNKLMWIPHMRGIDRAAYSPTRAYQVDIKEIIWALDCLDCQDGKGGLLREVRDTGGILNFAAMIRPKLGRIYKEENKT